MHLHDQTLNAGTPLERRVVVLIQNPVIPEPARPGAEGIVVADVAAFVCSQKTGGEAVLVLRNRFTLSKAGEQVLLGYSHNDTMIPVVADDFRELFDSFADLVGIVLQTVVQKQFPQRARLL